MNGRPAEPPVGIEQRVLRALARVRRECPDAADLTFIGIDEDVVVMQIAEDGRSGAQPPPVSVLARAIAAEAPEVTALRIEGVPQRARQRGLVGAARVVRGGTS